MNKKLKERTNRERKNKYQFPNDHRYKIEFKNYFFCKKIPPQQIRKWKEIKNQS